MTQMRPIENLRRRLVYFGKRRSSLAAATTLPNAIHLLLTFSGCAGAVLRDVAKLQVVFENAVRSCGASIVGETHHEFPGYGLTSVLLLAESHASLHTYPELETCFVDLFACGKSLHPERLVSALLQYLQPEHHSSRVVRRSTRGAKPSLRTRSGRGTKSPRGASVDAMAP